MANPSSSLETCSRPWYLWPNILGLDAPLVAVLWCWFYAQVQGISLPHPIHLLLGGAVWSIYTIDRLLDVRYIRSVGAAWTERHRFAARFFWAFLAVLIMVTGAGLYGAGAILSVRTPHLGTNGPQMLVWGFFLSTTVLFHATSTINSLDHMIGSRRFPTGDDSRNNAALAVLTLGEGWHNNHHRYAVSARQGFYWWEVDVTFHILQALALLNDVP